MTKKAKVNGNHQNKNEKQMEHFVNCAWSVIDDCLDVMKNRLTLMAEDVGLADISKLTQMFGSVFDRLMEIIGNETDNQAIKKLEDFE